MTMKRKFGHCVANWTIQNSHMLLKNFPFRIFSPEFEVRGFIATKWVMKLKNEEIDGEFMLNFELEILDSDEEKLPFCGECHIEIKNEKTPFQDFTWKVDSNKMKLIERIQPDHNSHILFLENLYIKCKLLIVFASVEEDIEPYHEVGLEELTQDLLRLYEMKEYKDVTLNVSNKHSIKRINAHKPILQSRSTVFRSMLRSSTKEVTVDIFGPIEEWDNIVKFLYTADMKLVLNPPKISYYDISKKYKIEPIASFYQPEKFNLYSTVPIEEFGITCTIPDFVSNDKIFINFPQVIYGTQNTIWKISVHSVTFFNQHYTCFFVEVTEKACKSVLLDIYAINRNGKELLHQMYGKIGNNVSFENVIFYLRENLNHYAEDENLKLLFKFQMVSEEKLLNECKRYSVTNMKCSTYCEKPNFSILYRDMRNLFYDRNDQEYNFVIGSDKFFVHECILSVRAKDLLEKIRENKVVKNESVSRCAVIRLIYFLYTGICYYDFSRKDNSALYKLADFFDIRNLKSMLEKHDYD